MFVARWRRPTDHYAPDPSFRLQFHVPTQGRTPRSFGLSPNGRWLLAANQDSDTVVSFRIDEATGVPEPAGAVAGVPTPVCVKFLAAAPLLAGG